MENYKYIILGSGIAAYNAAKEILKECDDVVMISKEGPTYLRPLLSKTTFSTYNINLTYMEELNCKMILEEVVDIDVEKQVINGKYHYEKCIYALGAESRKMDIGRKMFTLRHANDFYAIKRQLPFSKTIGIIGGGVIGIEIALLLASMHKQVTIYEYAPLLLGRYFNDDASNYLIEKLNSYGIEVVLNSRKQSYDEDLMIGCIGNAVNNLFHEDIIPDEYLCFKNNLYVCGDCVKGNAALWDEASNQGIVAGQNVLGKQVEYKKESLPLIMNHEDWSIYATSCDFDDFSGIVDYQEELMINQKTNKTYLSIKDHQAVLIGNIQVLEKGESLWKS